MIIILKFIRNWIKFWWHIDDRFWVFSLSQFNAPKTGLWKKASLCIGSHQAFALIERRNCIVIIVEPSTLFVVCVSVIRKGARCKWNRMCVIENCYVSQSNESTNWMSCHIVFFYCVLWLSSIPPSSFWCIQIYMHFK